MPSIYFSSFLLTFLALHFHFGSVATTTVQVPLPFSLPKNGLVVPANFFGISFEMTFLNYYFGNDTQSVPQPMVNYLSTLTTFLPSIPLRIRVGGNSMDSSTFVSNQTQMIIWRESSNRNDQPSHYGPTLFRVMSQVASDIGGVDYLVGLSLRQPNSSLTPLAAASANQILGNSIEAFVIGNEPDLYQSQGIQARTANYTISNYVQDYSTVVAGLDTTSAGNITAMNKLAGPSICCTWDLVSTIQPLLASFKQEIKFITTQHYPQSSCGNGTVPPILSFFLSHSNVVNLGQWQSPGIQLARQQGKPVIMAEFSSSACGGSPGVSDTFGATLWSVDYVLQMAATGYSAAYMHTRERGRPYNLFQFPLSGNAQWTTNATYYAYFPVMQALQSHNGSKVVDMNVDGSTTSNSSYAGYAIFDASTNDLYRVVLLNYANGTGPVDFAVQKGMIPQTGNNITVKYLVASSVNEKTRISWGGITLAGVGDGKYVDSGNYGDVSMDCVNGCSVSVPSPGLAVLLVNKVLPQGEPGGNGTVARGVVSTLPSSAQSDGFAKMFLLFAIPVVVHVFM